MTRAEKAQRLVDEGRVSITSSNDLATYAFVTDGSKTYFAVLYPSSEPSSEYFCDCRGVHWHCYTDDLCAHALAVKLAVEKEVGDAEA